MRALVQPGTALLRRLCATGSTGVDTVRVSSLSARRLLTPRLAREAAELLLEQAPANPRAALDCIDALIAKKCVNPSRSTARHPSLLTRAAASPVPAVAQWAAKRRAASLSQSLPPPPRSIPRPRL